MKKGFTLIELLVVVLIIGILSAVALPQYQAAVDKSRFSTLMALGNSFKNDQELFYLANGRYSEDLNELCLQFLWRQRSQSVQIFGRSSGNGK